MDFDDLSIIALKTARDHGVTIATAESCTGGLIASALTEIAGSSNVVECGFVTYSNTAKIRMLDVKPKTLETFGAVSEQIALEMALGARTRSNVDLAVSVTGIAGPGGSDHKPEGRVCFGIARKNGNPFTETVEFGPLGRANVRSETVKHALKLLTKFAALSGD